MKLLGQVVAVEPLALIVSLPNQLFAHVPITQISAQLTHALENMEDADMESSDEDDDEPSPSRVPDLFEIFQPGQYVRGVVTAVHASGATDTTGLGRARDEVQKASRRVELSLVPDKVNEGIAKGDLKPGFVRIRCQNANSCHSHSVRHFPVQSRAWKTMVTSSTWVSKTSQASSPSRMPKRGQQEARSSTSVGYWRSLS